ncbi:hypothetical protein ALISP_6400 [Alicycliphilus sp. B1]|nr:hypothetical protein ALISP_6400 [Alicycliphilus sp. B1]
MYSTTTWLVPWLHRLVRAAEGDGAAGLRLQRQGRHLQHMGQRQALVGAVGVQRADLGEACAQAVLEAGQGAVVSLVGLAVHDGLHGGAAGPEVGAAQGADAGDLHGVLLLSQIGL